MTALFRKPGVSTQLATAPPEASSQAGRRPTKRLLPGRLLLRLVKRFLKHPHTHEPETLPPETACYADSTHSSTSLSISESAEETNDSENGSDLVQSQSSSSSLSKLQEDYTFHVAPIGAGAFGKAYVLRGKKKEGMEREKYLVLKVVRLRSEDYSMYRMEVEALQRLQEHPHDNIVKQPSFGSDIDNIWWSKNDATISLLFVSCLLSYCQCQLLY